MTGTRLPALIVSKYESAIKNGIIVLLFHVGLAIGLAIAGLYMQSHQISVSTIAGLQSVSTIAGLQSVSTIAGLQSYPSAEAYNLIFLTTGVISLVSIGLVLFLKKQTQ